MTREVRAIEIIQIVENSKRTIGISQRMRDSNVVETKAIIAVKLNNEHKEENGTFQQRYLSPSTSDTYGMIVSKDLTRMTNAKLRQSWESQLPVLLKQLKGHRHLTNKDELVKMNSNQEQSEIVTSEMVIAFKAIIVVAEIHNLIVEQV